MSDWPVKSLGWCLCGDTLPEVDHAKVAPRFLDAFQDTGVSREFGKAAKNSYKADGTDSSQISSLAIQRAFVGHFNHGPTGSASGGTGGGKDV